MRRRFVILGALLLLVFLGAYAWHLAHSPPGQERTIDEGDHPKPSPGPPTTPMDTFRLAWNSEASADWPVSESLALMSEQAYLPPVDAEPAYRKLGFDRVTPVVAGSMIGYVVSGADVTVIVFRGTNPSELCDWCVNLDCLSTQVTHGAIHKGFYSAYQLLKGQITKSLSGTKPRHLWITGHSLGGALAVVCAYDLIENERLDLDGIITFGQPMVARRQLAEHLDTVLLGRYAHYVNEADIVPRVPPTYSHCGSLVWFTGGGIKRSKPKRPVVGAVGPKDSSPTKGGELIPLSQEEFEQWKTSIRRGNREPKRLPDGTLLVEGNAPWIRDHPIELYLEKIRSVLGAAKANRPLPSEEQNAEPFGRLPRPGRAGSGSH